MKIKMYAVGLVQLHFYAWLIIIHNVILTRQGTILRLESACSEAVKQVTLMLWIIRMRHLTTKDLWKGPLKCKKSLEGKWNKSDVLNKKSRFRILPPNINQYIDLIIKINHREAGPMNKFYRTLKKKKKVLNFTYWNRKKIGKFLYNCVNLQV